MKLTSKEITESLAKLGNTADEIAQSLQVKSIVGDQGDVSFCPIAIYLKGEFPTMGVDVDPDAIYLWDLGGPSFECHVKPPLAVKTFIGDFDRATYPELIAEESDD